MDAEHIDQAVQDVSDLQWAYRIMAGRTMMQPTVEHLFALREAHECDLITMRALLRDMQQKFPE